MGTVVLSPQDCLSSPHSRQNHYISSMSSGPSSASRERRRGSQASIAALPPASDCARCDSSDGAIMRDGRGLLPILYPPGQARALLKISSPSKAPSTSLPRGGRDTPSISQSKLSRTVSETLPSPQGSALPLSNGGRSHILNGRLLFKLVQSNGPGNVAEDTQNNNPKPSKKFVGVRNGVLKKFTNTREHARGLKKREPPDGHQGMKSASKVSQERVGMDEHPRDVDGKTIVKELDKGHSVKEVGGKLGQAAFPVVRILQRQKNQEAAVELLTKFFQKTAESEVSDVKDEQAEDTSHDLLDLEKSDGMGIKSETKGGISEGSSQFEFSSEVGTCQTSADEDVQVVPMEELLNGIHLPPPATMMSECVVGQCNAEPSSFPKQTVTPGSGREDFIPWERWGGSAYFNSPPPSSLPLPRFLRKQSKAQPSSTTEGYKEFTPLNSSSINL